MSAELESRVTALEEQLHRLEELQDGDRATLRLHGLLHEQTVEVHREHELPCRGHSNQVAELGGELGRRLKAIEEKRDERLKSLKEDIRRQSDEIIELKIDVSAVKADVRSLQADMRGVQTDVSGLKADVAGLQADMAEVKTDVAGLKADVTLLKTDMAEVKTTLGDHSQKLDQIIGLLRAS